MDYCNLQNLKVTKGYYIWINKQIREERMVSKIDGFLVNDKWLTELPTCEVRFGNKGLLDHCPTIIQCEEE